MILTLKCDSELEIKRVSCTKTGSSFLVYTCLVLSSPPFLIIYSFPALSKIRDMNREPAIGH